MAEPITRSASGDPPDIVGMDIVGNADAIDHIYTYSHYAAVPPAGRGRPVVRASLPAGRPPTYERGVTLRDTSMGQADELTGLHIVSEMAVLMPESYQTVWPFPEAPTVRSQNGPWTAGTELGTVDVTDTRMMVNEV